ncbi:hypothetical protein [Salinicola socius]|uniref:hypothetical protein n=1 Tax=Salinicola socius TaxID=404433 RepID=UPI0013014F55|nr:hypothetical protein [Salinicola socius]
MKSPNRHSFASLPLSRLAGSILLGVALVMLVAGVLILCRYRDHVLPSLSRR